MSVNEANAITNHYIYIIAVRVCDENLQAAVRCGRRSHDLHRGSLWKPDAVAWRTVDRHAGGLHRRGTSVCKYCVCVCVRVCFCSFYGFTDFMNVCVRTGRRRCRRTRWSVLLVGFGTRWSGAKISTGPWTIKVNTVTKQTHPAVIKA